MKFHIQMRDVKKNEFPFRRKAIFDAFYMAGEATTASTLLRSPMWERRELELRFGIFMFF